MDFYNAIAGDYETIVDAAGRAAGIEAFVGRLIERYSARSAVDVACGTGAYTFALAAAGVKTVGADISEGMVDRARAHAEQIGADIQWHVTGMQDISDHVTEPVDAVLCMGNSLPHILSDDDLAKTIAAFQKLVNPEGVAVVHLLNYDRILADGERIVGITRVDDVEYVRFYDFFHGRLRFNILEVRWAGDRATHKLHSTELRPYRSGELVDAFTQGGFATVETYGTQAFDPFDVDQSDALVLVARP
jgi:glycine/sarcosine N-methyltransferase